MAALFREKLRELPVGADVTGAGTAFRVWARGHDQVDVVVGSQHFPLQSEGNGYFSGLISEVGVGDTYQYCLSGEKETLPDPASRFQPDGPHGPSQIVDPASFSWTDKNWRGVTMDRAVVYEMHVGTFTPEGTWRSAAERLPHLRKLGVTVIEVMPVADFSGSWGWGYDGVNLFAPTRLYGAPDDMRAFVDQAHAHGIAVILDVVYNHLGADGNYLGQFARDYFSTKYTTDWGDALNFDGPNNGPVREYFIANAAYWIREFHLDGLRVDATQNIYDESSPHILAEITRAVREAAHGRTTLMIAENEPQHTQLVRSPSRGGYGMDGLWNDDFHHSAVVALTGHNDAYYTDYLGNAQEFVAAAKHGYLYQGQWYKWQGHRRGTSTRGLEPSSFVTFIENHDQVANSAHGTRMNQQSNPGLLRAMTALMLTGPGTPMLFQGQEFASSKPFYYFADVPSDLAKLVRDGRKEFMMQWRTIRNPQMMSCLQDPCAKETFEASKLDWTDAERNNRILDLHRDLLQIRREDPVFSSWKRGEYDAAILTDRALVIRRFSDDHGDRLLIVNLDRDLHLNPAPEPLLAPEEGRWWEVLLSTEDPKYGGCGTAIPDTDENWRIPGNAALLLKSVIRPADAKERTNKPPKEQESE